MTAMIELEANRLTEVAVLGAHCDDIAIGLGGTLLTIARSNPQLRVRALVLSGAGTEREAEERSALAAFCPGLEVDLTLLDIPDGRAPAHWSRVKNALADFRASSQADVVFATQCRDAHQDHRLLAELVPTEFRDHLVLGYEIVKWETDDFTPTVFHPLDTETAVEKAQLLCKHYPSQAGRDWFDEETFLGLSRVRGVQCRHTHAEAFTIQKATIRFGGST
jgi:LmbE family N-acetylglucosaminyl deacetylase